MNRWLTSSVSCLGSLLIAIAAGCGPLGRDAVPSGAPLVAHVIFIDLNRGLNPDLLNNAPARACSTDNPCVAPVRCGELFFYGSSSFNFVGFPFSTSPEDAQCHDSENINEVAPSVDTVVRVAFNKQLDTDGIEVEDPADPGLFIINDPRVLQVSDPAGNPVPGTLVYDRTGSTQGTSDPGFLPYGPALVFTPDAPLDPDTEYRIALEPSLVKARDNGQSVDADQTSFRFRTEPLLVLNYINCPAISGGNGNCAGPAGTAAFPDPDYPLYGIDPNPGCETDSDCQGVSGSCNQQTQTCTCQQESDCQSGSCDLQTNTCPDPSGPQRVAVNQALQYQFDADIDPSSLGSITIRGGGANIPVLAVRHVDDPSTECPPGPGRVIDILPVDPITGLPSTWAPGDYTLTIPGGANGVRYAATGSTIRTVRDFTLTFPVRDKTVPSDDPFAIGTSIQTCP